MALILPDPRLEMPSLLTPGVKPTAPVVVDWSHPAATGNFLALLFNDTNIQEVSGSRRLLSLTNTGGTSPLLGSRGMSFEPASANDQNDNAITFDNQWGGALRSGAKRPFTIAFQFSSNDVTPTDQQGIFQVGTSNGTNGYYVYVDTNSTLVSAAGRWDNGKITKSIVDNTVYSVVITCHHNSGSRTDMWVDGAYVGQGYYSFGDVTFDEIGEIGRLFSTNSYGDCLNGNIYCFFAWDYLLPDSLCQSLSYDLYQFLIPA